MSSRALIYYYSWINFFDFSCFCCFHYCLNGACCYPRIDLLFCLEIGLVIKFKMCFLSFTLCFHSLIFGSYTPHFIMLLNYCFQHLHFFISFQNRWLNFKNYLQFLQIKIEVNSKFDLLSD